MPKVPPVPIAARVFFLVTALAATAIVLRSGSTPPGREEWAWWLAVLPVAVLCHYPVVVTRGSNAIEIGFESVVVIFLAFAVPGHALVLWTGGWVVARLKAPGARGEKTTAPWIRLYNDAMSVLSGAATVFVVGSLVPHALEPGPWALLAVGLGAVAYFFVDYVLSAVATPLLGRGSFRGSWRYDNLAITLACFGGVAALGYLGAVAVEASPWALPLLLVPVWTVVVASRGYVDASRERARLAALFAIAARLQHAETAEDATAIVLEEGRLALRVEQLSLLADPQASSPRAPIMTGGTQTWLVPHARRSNEDFTAQDEQTLELLASLASESLRSIALLVELETLATHDALTGLPNRASLHRSLEAELAAPTDLPTAILFCDLDGFKSVNDHRGHEAGDQMLTVVADRMSACVRAGDLVSRLGGDEFVVLLPRTSQDEALATAERILVAICSPGSVVSGFANVGISIGVAISDASSTADELLNRADTAMYDAKASGRGRVSLSPAAKSAADRLVP